MSHMLDPTFHRSPAEAIAGCLGRRRRRAELATPGASGCHGRVHSLRPGHPRRVRLLGAHAQASGAGAAAALALYRFLEGSAVALAASAAARWHWPCTGSPKAWPRGALLGAGHVAWRAGRRP